MDKRELNKVIKNNNLDVIVSTAYQTRLWFTGIQASAGYLFIKKGKSTLFVDSRYIEHAEKNAINVEVKLLNKDNLSNFIKDNKFKIVGIEGDRVTLDELEGFKKLFGKVKFTKINSNQLRIVKSEAEIKIMEAAHRIQKKGLKWIEQFIKPGITEIELANKLDNKYKELGAEKVSFDSIIASGPNGSKPHAVPTTKKLKSGELVTIDTGIVYKGYATDVTRTFVVGKLTNKKLIEIQKVLIEAQKLGVKAVKPGISTQAIDKVCRDYIKEAGYGQYFVHATGHGLGIDVHELPNVSPLSDPKFKLRAGMVITVEPGIYIPKIGGIRIEDDVLITKTGHKVLSKY